MDIETVDNKIKEGIIKAALRSIPKSKGKGKQKVVPWWDDVLRSSEKQKQGI